MLEFTTRLAYVCLAVAEFISCDLSLPLPPSLFPILGSSVHWALVGRRGKCSTSYECMYRCVHVLLAGANSTVQILRYVYNNFKSVMGYVYVFLFLLKRGAGRGSMTLIRADEWRRSAVL